MDYRDIVFRDKRDIDDLFKAHFPYAEFVGARQKMKNLDAQILSVKFTKVGAGTIKKMKNLKWVVNRRANLNNINIGTCKKGNVGVSLIYPNVNIEVSKYICKHLIQIPNYENKSIVIWGFGKIAKGFVKLMNNPKMKYIPVNSKTPKESYKSIISKAEILIISCGINSNTKGVFNYSLLNNLPKNSYIISISEGQVFDNLGLLELLAKGKIENITIDILSENLQENILETGYVNYTQHTAWNTEINSLEYAQLTKKCIDSIIYDKPINIGVRRAKEVFDFFR